MIDTAALLNDATTVLFIDWSPQDVPGTLVRAGYTVYGHEPNGYHLHAIAEEPTEVGGRMFPLEDGGYLVATSIDGPPANVDLVSTFRPPEEQPAIAQIAIDLGAKSLWVQPPAASNEDARVIAEAAGLRFVDGVSIADAVRELGRAT